MRGSLIVPFIIVSTTGFLLTYEEGVYNTEISGSRTIFRHDLVAI